LIITGTLGYAQRREADGRKWPTGTGRKDVTGLIEIAPSRAPCRIWPMLGARSDPIGSAARQPIVAIIPSFTTTNRQYARSSPLPGPCPARQLLRPRRPDPGQG